MCFGVNVLRRGWQCGAGVTAHGRCCRGCGHGVGGGFGCRDVAVAVGVGWCLWQLEVWDECFLGAVGAG